jgi:putative endonuclease
MDVRAVLAKGLRRLFPTKTLGQRGEAAAARYLRRRGYKILARGDHYGRGELDLVVLDRKKTIVFVEVKTRRSAEMGHPAEAVDRYKQRKLTQLAKMFLKRYKLESLSARFDVIAVVWPAERRCPTIEHIENAFEASE